MKANRRLRKSAKATGKKVVRLSRGRKPGGARAGERVEDYPQLTLRVPPELKAALHVISLITSKPRWRVLCDAVECQISRFPKPDQELVRNLIGHSTGNKQPLPLCGGPPDDEESAA